ncbi:MAG TPA: glycosyltransferase family 4 protein [Mycobacteriales bacterium]|nr:glycosyltransferase family 4 protein [Mycobacteriales bacterium]
MPDPTTVALVLATSTGGVGRHVRSLVDGYVARGVGVRVLAPADTDARFGLSAAGAEFVDVPIAAGTRPLADLRAAAALRHGLGDATVVHAHGLRAGLLAVLVGGPRPVVVTWHNLVLGSAPARSVYALLERVVARRATVTLTVSPDLTDRVRRLGGRDVRPTPVAALPGRGATRDRAETRGEMGATDRPLVLAAGRLHPQKGFDTLIRASCAWTTRQSPPVVVLAGDGPLRDELAGLVRRLDAPVRLLGHRDDVADLLAAADVLVVPSRWEGRSLLVQEAMRAGTAIVAAATGGTPDLVQDAALLVPAGDVAALVGGVSALLDDAGERAALGARARKVAAGWPSADEVAAQTLALYRELLGPA